MIIFALQSCSRPQVEPATVETFTAEAGWVQFQRDGGVPETEHSEMPRECSIRPPASMSFRPDGSVLVLASGEYVIDVECPNATHEWRLRARFPEGVLITRMGYGKEADRAVGDELNLSAGPYIGNEAVSGSCRWGSLTPGVVLVQAADNDATVFAIGVGKARVVAICEGIAREYEFNVTAPAQQ